jgi:cytochrome c peroxidase
MNALSMSPSPPATPRSVHRSGCLARPTLLIALTTLGVAFTARGLNVPDDATLRTNALLVFQTLPDRMPGSENDTPSRIALGKKLYFETRLSKNESQSCNTCHQVDDGKAGVDNEPTSDGAFGDVGDRNSPTVWNAGFHIAQFWDGRAADLVEQAKGPVLNPVEMAMSSEAEVVERLTADTEYPKLFKQAFPQDSDPVSYENMAQAIAAFERTLISRDRFDDFLSGDTDALTPAEKEGLVLFLDIGCTTCHNGPVIGGNAYHKSGLVNPYEFQKDKGRFEATKEEDDEFKFKVPSLRNVALTSPYFHDGRVAELSDVVKRMGWMQLAKELTDAEVKSIVAFLNSLSGKGLVPGTPHENEP